MTAKQKELLELKLLELIIDLGWDYDRLSTAGQKTYNDIIKILEGLKQ